MAGFSLEDLAKADAESGDPDANQSSEINTSEIDQEEEKSLLERLASIPSALKDAYTGEGQEIEFPEVPEATDMGGEAPGFVEGIIPNIKAMMARDDVGKLEIFENSFKDDPRWGGGFQDKYGNPMMIWNNKPYYVNKPGASSQDFGTFVGEIIKYIPAMKVMKKAKNAKQTIGLGVPTYGATEAGSQALESQMTPKTTASKNRDLSDVASEVGTATAIGVGADLALPPVARAISAPIKVGARAVSGGRIFPRFDPQSSQFPLTQGQRTAQLPDSKAGPTPKTTPELEEEDVLRRASGTDAEASMVIRGFDEQQLDQIRAEAQALQSEFGSGSPLTNLDQTDVSGVAAEELKDIVGRQAGDVKTRAGQAYTDVRNAKMPPKMTVDGIRTNVEFALNAVRQDIGITNAELVSMPLLKRELQFLQKLYKLTGKEGFKDQPLKQIHGYQKRLNRAVRSAEQGSPEQLALGEIKKVFDKAVFDGIEDGFMYGDELVLNQLKDATELYKTYIGLTGKGRGANSAQRAANSILEKVTNPDYTPRQVANAIFGHNKFAPNQAVPLVIDRLKSNLPEEQYEEVVGLLKDAILEKAFSGAGKSGVTRSNIVNNYDDIFVKNKAIINKLFSPEEISRVSKFREDVMPTLWAEIKLNPSNSAYTLLGAMTRSGLMNFARGIPIVGADIVGAVEGAQQRSQASNVIRQYVARSGAPLFSSISQAATRPEIVETVSTDQSPSASSILDSIDEETRKKILESYPQ